MTLEVYPLGFVHVFPSTSKYFLHEQTTFRDGLTEVYTSSGLFGNDPVRFSNRLQIRLSSYAANIAGRILNFSAETFQDTTGVGIV